MAEAMDPGRLSVLVVGGLNLDILGTGSGPFLEGDSIPGFIEMKPGGVGCNIASHLARAGVRTELMTVLGDDLNAGLLRAACAEKGIGLSLSFQGKGPSPRYLAIHDMRGEMRAAVNDTRLLEALSPDGLRAALLGNSGFQACVLDANLSEACLQAAVSVVSVPLIADPVSTVKCLRLLSVMNRLTAIKPNLMEALAMTGEDSPERAANALLRLGVKQVYISLGSEGVYYADAYKSGMRSAPRLHGVSVTGAGDAMAAGITLGVAMKLPADETAMLGIRLAYEYLSGISDATGSEEER